MKKTLNVDVTTLADMSARVTVQVEAEGKTEEEVYDEAERLAQEKISSGDVEWNYDGVKEPEEYNFLGIS